jgi:alpha-tubulin suppressor-like RCC1 family protein
VRYGSLCTSLGSDHFCRYGPRGNSLLLLHYGFAIQENTYDTVDFEATVHHGSSCIKLQCSLTRKLSLDLWIFLRAACQCSLRDFEVSKELGAISAVLRLLQSLRLQWPTSLDDDEKLLQKETEAPSMPLRNRFSLFHRIGRKRIVWKMETAMAYLSRCLSNGYQSCSANDRDILESASCHGDCRVLEALAQQLCGLPVIDVSPLYCCAIHSLRKSRRSGMPEEGVSLPTVVASTSCGQILSKVTFVACGQNMSACIQDGVLFTTGSADFGKLGHSKTEFDVPHQEIMFRAVPQLNKVVVVSCGGNHSVCIDASGAVFSWGENVYGQCGLGFTCQQVTSPRGVVVDQLFNAVVCGEALTLISNSTQVYACGCNLEGECGLESRDASVDIPTRVQLPDGGIRKVCCRWRHSIVVMEDGHVYVWGSADSSRIGVPATHRIITAKSLSANDDSSSSFGKNAQHARDSCVNVPLLLASCGTELPAVVDAAAGFKMSVFITRDGAVYACGAVGHDESEMPLHLVAGLPLCKRVWTGSSHGFLLTKNDALLAFGKTSSGRLCCDSANDVKHVPISEAASMVVDLPGMSGITMVACGQAQSLFVLTNGNTDGNADASHLHGGESSLVACGRIECVAYFALIGAI